MASIGLDKLALPQLLAYHSCKFCQTTFLLYGQASMSHVLSKARETFLGCRYNSSETQKTLCSLYISLLLLIQEVISVYFHKFPFFVFRC